MTTVAALCRPVQVAGGSAPVPGVEWLRGAVAGRDVALGGLRAGCRPGLWMASGCGVCQVFRIEHLNPNRSRSRRNRRTGFRGRGDCALSL